MALQPGARFEPVMSVWATWRPVAIAAAVSVPLWLSVFALSANAHAGRILLCALFPFGPLIASLGHFAHGFDLAGFVAPLLQFPAYALILRAGARRQRFRAAVACVFGIHAVTMALAARGWY